MHTIIYVSDSAFPCVRQSCPDEACAREMRNVVHRTQAWWRIHRLRPAALEMDPTSALISRVVSTVCCPRARRNSQQRCTCYGTRFMQEMARGPRTCFKPNPQNGHRSAHAHVMLSRPRREVRCLWLIEGQPVHLVVSCGPAQQCPRLLTDHLRQAIRMLGCPQS
jgi:hypothetical protein